MEQIRGRWGFLHRCRNEADLAHGYCLLKETVLQFNQFPIIDYDPPAQQIFASLHQQKLRIGSQDMRIAAITLAVSGILITRNAVDFNKVPGLTLQDWTV